MIHYLADLLTAIAVAGETQACADAASEHIAAVEEAAELAAAEADAAAADAAVALRSAKLESLEAAEAAMAELMTLQADYDTKLCSAQVGEGPVARRPGNTAESCRVKGIHCETEGTS